MKKMKKTNLIVILLVTFLLFMGCDDDDGDGGDPVPNCDPSGTQCQCVCPDGETCGPTTCTGPNCEVGVDYCPSESDICFGMNGGGPGNCYYGYGVNGVILHCGLAAITDAEELESPNSGLFKGVLTSTESGTIREVAPPCLFNCGTGTSAESIVVVTLDCDPLTNTNCKVPLIDVSESASENAPIYGVASWFYEYSYKVNKFCIICEKVN